MSAARAHIASLRWRPFRVRMQHRFEAAHGVLANREGVLLELVTAEGARGVGEASPLPSLEQGTVDDVIALLRSRRVGAGLPDAPDVPGANALRCALDVASLDAEARARGVPLAALLCQQPRAWVAVNAVIGAGSPEETARYALDAIEAGYSVVKVKVGVGSLAEDVARVRALREACPDAAIRLDANGAWGEATALAAVEALAPFGIELIEQPVPVADVGALARVHARAPMPIAADEAVADPAARARVFEQRAADLVVLKPMMLGGITTARAIARQAAERGMGALVTTTFDTSIGTAAALHLAASLPSLLISSPLEVAHGLSTGEHLAADVAAVTLRPEAGRMAVPCPGLGIEVDEAALDAVATGPWVEVPW